MCSSFARVWVHACCCIVASFARVCVRLPCVVCSACHHIIFEAARVGEKAEQKILAKGCYKKWIQYSLHERAKLKMLATDSSWTDMNPRGCEHMTDRVFDLVNVGWQKIKEKKRKAEETLARPKATKRARKTAEEDSVKLEEHFIDLSQAVQRVRPTRNISLLHTHPVVWSYKFDMVLPAEFHMRLQGWPRHFCELPTPTVASEDRGNKLKCFSGQGMTLPILATVLYAYFLNPHGTWWKPPHSVRP